MKKIPLGNGVFALVDDQDFDLVAGYSWYLHVTPTGKRYARTETMKNRVKTRIWMHRLIMNAQNGKIVDHQDGDGLNNLRINLRHCTFSQNMGNSKAREHSSRFKGVSWSRRDKKWAAQIELGDRKSRWLGYFNSEVDAAQAYDKAAEEVFGSFARLNIK